MMSSPPDSSEQYLKAFTQTLRSYRLRRKLTHEQVAERADISANYYARIERGEINFSYDKLICIAEALNTRPSLLFKATEKLLDR